MHHVQIQIQTHTQLLGETSYVVPPTLARHNIPDIIYSFFVQPEAVASVWTIY